MIQQVKEWGEIIINWETANRYKLMDINKNEIGFVAERHKGLMTTLGRQFLRSHRPFSVDIFNESKKSVLHLSRKFFFFFSNMFIETNEGVRVGAVRRRFGILNKKYDLCDEYGRVFATVKSPFWKIWTFPIIDRSGKVQGAISKKWGGVLKEVFTDADCFLLDYGQGAWTDNQRAVLLATAISIDFDFFEDNNSRN